VMFTGLHAGGTSVGVVDVVPMGMAVIPVFKLLDCPPHLPCKISCKQWEG
jgi:hypothetical protein